MLVLAACSGPTKTTRPPEPPAPDARVPTPAELALEAHRERLLDHRGVVDVRVDGDALVVDVCAPEITPDLTGIAVPATALPGAWPETARGEPCGCSERGVYHDDGALIARDCNACTCHAGAIDACTSLDCRMHPAERIGFTRNSAELDDAARALLDAFALGLLDHPTAQLLIRGHADPREVSVAKLSKKRAATVRGHLLKAGVPKAQLAIEGKGADASLGGAAEADRRVDLEVTE